MFYFHINQARAAGKQGEQSVLNINAGLEPTRLRAKLFLPAYMHLDSIVSNMRSKGVDMKDIIIYSGDTVRFKHQESNSYLQS